MKQREGDCTFDAQAINKMELLILDALEWRMRSITPFPFLQFFLSLSKFQDPTLIQALKRRASELIINALNGTNLTIMLANKFFHFIFGFQLNY